MTPTFFSSPEAFRAWLAEHHSSERELLVGFRKVGSGKASVTWPQSVDEALCFGWIDGVRRRIDDESYSIRFTPRRPGSIWSRVNIRRFHELVAEGRMTPAGQAAFDAGRERTDHYSYENALRELAPDETARFQANPSAWIFWSAQAPSYRKPVLWWITSAKKAETRARRLRTVIEASAEGRKIEALSTAGKRS